MMNLTDTAASMDVRDEVERDGFTIVHDVLQPDQVAQLLDVLEHAAKRDGIMRRGGILAVRNLLEVVPEVVELAQSLRPLAEAALGASCFAVRGILFDKTPETNWKVAWHQDLTIAVKNRIDVPGFGPWSTKAGVDSVQPAVEVLERMITLRVNLDDCGDDNGPVRVIPGTHAHGRLTASEIAAWRERGAEVSTTAPAGAALLMKPLLLHASSAASSPRHRRVIHIDYAAVDLPGGLDWHIRI